MSRSSIRFPFAFLCLLLFLPALSACSDSSSASAGSYAAFQGTWELDEGKYLSRVTFDLPTNRISYVRASKDGLTYEAAFGFVYKTEVKGDTLRISDRLYNDPSTLRIEELKINTDGTLTSNVIWKAAQPVDPIPQATFTRPNKANDGLFARVVPVCGKMGGEWIDPNTKEMLARIDTETGKVDLFGRLADHDLEKKAINALSYMEHFDPQLHDPFGARLFFEDHRGKAVFIEMDDPAKTRPNLRFNVGRSEFFIVKK